MGLALDRPRPDRSPRDEVGQVLGRDRVEQFGRRPQAEPVDVDQELSRQAQSERHVVAAVEMRIVDETLPADRAPRLLEIHAHEKEKPRRQAFGEAAQASRVVDRGLRVVNRARTHDREQPPLAPGDDVAHGRPSPHDDLVDGVGRLQLLLEVDRRHERLGLDDAQVLRAEHFAEA